MKFTFMEKVADIISGGSLTFYANGWNRSSAINREAIAVLEDERNKLKAEVEQLKSDLLESWYERDALESDLRHATSD